MGKEFTYQAFIESVIGMELEKEAQKKKIMISKPKLIQSKEYWIEMLENMDYNKLSYEQKANQILEQLKKVKISKL